MPATSRSIRMRMIAMAGRLTMPPAVGPFTNASGRPSPIAVSALLK